MSDPNSSLPIILLLMRHCIVDEDGDHCWSVHSKAANILILLSPGPDAPSTFTAFQAVLARTACSLTDSRILLSHEHDWLGVGTENELWKIDGNTGITRAVLFTINSIIRFSHSKVGLIHHTYAYIRLIALESPSPSGDMQSIRNQLEAIRQTTPMNDDDQDQILLKTAESYRMAAQVSAPQAPRVRHLSPANHDKL